MTEVTIRAADGGSFKAYLATPKGAKGPGIVLIQEIFGVNKVMRDLADGFAAAGYVVLCPDLFWRQEPGVDITDQSKAEWDKAFSLYQGFNVDKGVDDLKATLAALRQHPACSGKVGSVGYCLGGKLAYLMATRSDSDCQCGILRRRHPGRPRRGQEHQEAADPRHRRQGPVLPARSPGPDQAGAQGQSPGDDLRVSRSRTTPSRASAASTTTRRRPTSPIGAPPTFSRNISA